MTVHYEIEALCDTLFKAACGAKPTIANATTDDAQVTCPRCLAALGYAIPHESTADRVIALGPVAKRLNEEAKHA